MKEEEKYIFYPLEKIGPSGGASLLMVCYQWGLPRLVSSHKSITVFTLKCLLLSVKPTTVFCMGVSSFIWILDTSKPTLT